MSLGNRRKQVLLTMDPIRGLRHRLGAVVPTDDGLSKVGYLELKGIQRIRRSPEDQDVAGFDVVVSDAWPAARGVETPERVQQIEHSAPEGLELLDGVGLPGLAKELLQVAPIRVFFDDDAAAALFEGAKIENDEFKVVGMESFKGGHLGRK